MAKIPFESMGFEPGAHFSHTTREVEAMDCIPSHRVSEVYRDGALVWQRAAAVNAARSHSPDSSS